MSEPFYVYVAGPLSDYPPQYLAYVSRLSQVSRNLALEGYVPINPAADMLEGLMGGEALPIETYQRRSLELLRLLEDRCGAVYVTARYHDDGRESKGVAEEIHAAKCRRIPVVYDRDELAELRAESEKPCTWVVAV